MSSPKIDKVIAFVTGDALVMLVAWFQFDSLELWHFGLKIVATIILGAIGGAAGMIGKDIYSFIKKKIHK